MIPRRRYNIEADFFHDAAMSIVSRSTGRNPVTEFENALAAYLSPDSETRADSNKSDSTASLTVQATSSGRAALAILLERLAVPKGATVMLPAYTLGAIGPFLTGLGYRWTTCDVACELPVMTPETVRAAWPEDESVRCVLVTHLFGVPADVPSIKAFAASRGACVIEDCAHSPGSMFDGRHTGTSGDGALFSFNYLKPVNCFGGGAAVIRGDMQMPTLPAQLHNEVAKMFAGGLLEDVVFAGPWLRIPTGMLASERLSPVMTKLDQMIRRPSDEASRNEAMSPMQALHGLRSLATLDVRLKARRAAARAIGTAIGLDVSMFMDDAATRSNAYFLTLKVPDAAEFRWRLWKRGIDAGTGTEVADYLACPHVEARTNALKWFEQTIQLPCYEALSEKKIRIIADVLADVVPRSRA